MNKIIISGHLGKNPEIQSFDWGKLATFSVATTEKYKNREGAMVAETIWHNVKCFGKQAEVIEKYFNQGSGIIVVGKQVNEIYEKDGQKRLASYIKLSSFYFPPKNSDNSTVSNQPNSNTTTQEKCKAGISEMPPIELEEDDFPF